MTERKTTASEAAAQDRTIPQYPLLAISRHRMEIDGEGVTTLVAGAGCPLSCAYCINKTLLCQDPTWVTPQELLEKVKIDDLYFQATGGGLTFGGGEALLHLDFYEALRPLCGPWRFTAETSLNLPRGTVERAARIFDAFIIDVKTLNGAIYPRYTGRAMGELIGNLKYLAETLDPACLHVRVPHIPDYTDDYDEKRTESILRTLGYTKIERFDYIVRPPDATV